MVLHFLAIHAVTHGLSVKLPTSGGSALCLSGTEAGRHVGVDPYTADLLKTEEQGQINELSRNNRVKFVQSRYCGDLKTCLLYGLARCPHSGSI